MTEPVLNDVLRGMKTRVDIPPHGFIELVDVMPRLIPEGRTGDYAIVEAARVSTNKGLKTPEEDEGLIRYMLRKHHSSPFEQVEVKFRMHLPIFVARQIIRHRTANVNEWSARYSELEPEYWMPSQWRKQGTSNKQGGEEPMEYTPGVYANVRPIEVDAEGRAEYGANVVSVADSVETKAFAEYARRLEAGVSREMARSCLPVSTYCYDRETEVLTDRGFVLWPNVKKTDRLGIWDESKNTLCYEVPKYLTCDDYKGKMYRVKHKGVDLCVTPNHKMWVDCGQGFGLHSADELGHRALVRYSKVSGLRGSRWSAPRTYKTKNSAALLTFMGFFIGDGNAPRKGDVNAVVFGLRRARKIRFLQDLCTKLGWVCDKRGPHFVVRHEGITKMFRELFYAADGQKVIPQFMSRLCREDSLAVLTGLFESDGAHRKGKIERFDTTSRQVSEAVVVLAVHAGLPVNVNKPRKRHKPCRSVHFVAILADRCARPVVNQMTRNTSWVDYCGKVYCAKTRTGVMVVRRNGKVSLSGNTEWVWKCDLHNILRFLFLRTDTHAQKEVRDYADAMMDLLSPLFPVTFRAWTDYVKEAVILSRMEVAALRAVFHNARASGSVFIPHPPISTNKREQEEWLAKRELLGMSGPLDPIPDSTSVTTPKEENPPSGT